MYIILKGYVCMIYMYIYKLHKEIHKILLLGPFSRLFMSPWAELCLMPLRKSNSCKGKGTIAGDSDQSRSILFA